MKQKDFKESIDKLREDIKRLENETTERFEKLTKNEFFHLTKRVDSLLDVLNKSLFDFQQNLHNEILDVQKSLNSRIDKILYIGIGALTTALIALLCQIIFEFVLKA